MENLFDPNTRLRVPIAACLLTTTFCVSWAAAALTRGFAGTSTTQTARANAPLAVYDFHNATQNAQWGGLHSIGKLRSTAEGLVVEITGADPYFTGPPRNLPRGVPLWAHLRLRSKQAGRVRL